MTREPLSELHPSQASKWDMMDQVLDLELERCGWKEADRHWNNAIDALLKRDDETYEREMSRCKAITATWEKNHD